jgi:hypothetical protein
MFHEFRSTLEQNIFFLIQSNERIVKGIGGVAHTIYYNYKKVVYYLMYLTTIFSCPGYTGVE